MLLNNMEGMQVLGKTLLDSDAIPSDLQKNRDTLLSHFSDTHDRE